MDYVKEEIVKIVVQFNGKKKSIIETSKDIDKDELIKRIKKNLIKDDINKLIVKKVIYVPNKIINFVI